MPPKYILAIDQGTTGSRAFIFDARGRIVASDYKEFKQYFPSPGWVEHDADEIFSSCQLVIKGAVRKAGIKASEIGAIGITNQRETTVMWDRKTSKPFAKAIVWQCRRTAEYCKKIRKFESLFRKKTGLVCDPYFSGTKIHWLLENIPGLRLKALKGEVAFGTIDSWLIWKLTGGQSHSTDMTNASRTLIFNIRKLAWDSELMKILKIPKSILPEVKPSGSIFGYTSEKASILPPGIPIAAVIGDQQSALYGQGCFAPGTIKNTYGTGCFLVLNTGKKMILSKSGLLSTIACDQQGQPVYALEGSVFIAGAVVQWVRDQLGAIKRSSDIEKILHGVKDAGGVYFVPAFTGLGAPYWDAQARGTICGLTRGSNLKHILRAALESIAYQTKDVFDLMMKESSVKISQLKVDGGACKNNVLMQFQSDILGCSLVRPTVTETTALGAAQLAGVVMGMWQEKKYFEKINPPDREFYPKMLKTHREKLFKGWIKAVAQARHRADV